MAKSEFDKCIVRAPRGWVPELTEMKSFINSNITQSEIEKEMQKLKQRKDGHDKTKKDKDALSDEDELSDNSPKSDKKGDGKKKDKSSKSDAKKKDKSKKKNKGETEKLENPFEEIDTVKRTTFNTNLPEASVDRYGLGRYIKFLNISVFTIIFGLVYHCGFIPEGLKEPKTEVN